MARIGRQTIELSERESTDTPVLTSWAFIETKEIVDELCEGDYHYAEDSFYILFGYKANGNFVITSEIAAVNKYTITTKSGSKYTISGSASTNKDNVKKCWKRVGGKGYFNMICGVGRLKKRLAGG